jgi:hypothetical protein
MAGLLSRGVWERESEGAEDVWGKLLKRSFPHTPFKNFKNNYRFLQAFGGGQAGAPPHAFFAVK